MVAAARATIPSVDALIAEAIHDLRAAGLTDEQVRADFGAALVKVEGEIETVYRRYEARALETLAESYLSRFEAIPNNQQRKENLKRVLMEAAHDIVGFEFSGGQSRKSRAGSTWEKITQQTLDLMGFPMEKPTGADARRFNQIDRIVPSIAVARERPDQAVYLSFKRTFREKWRVLVDESRLGYLYLVTLGDPTDITEDRVREMETKKIIAYVPKSVKDSTSFFQASRALREFNDLPRDLHRFERPAA